MSWFFFHCLILNYYDSIEKNQGCFATISSRWADPGLPNSTGVLPTELLSRVFMSPARKEVCGSRGTITSEQANRSREKIITNSVEAFQPVKRTKEYLVQAKQVKVSLREQLFEILACDDKEMSHHPSQWIYSKVKSFDVVT